MKNKKNYDTQMFLRPCGYSSTYLMRFYIFLPLTKHEGGQKRPTSVYVITTRMHDTATHALCKK